MTHATSAEHDAWPRRVTVLGVGLLGGSVGMSLRRHAIHVTGYSRRQSGCNSAIKAGAIDAGVTDVRQACRNSDVVVIASPVNKIAELAVAAHEAIGPAADGEGPIITDVGSTKKRIIDELQLLCPAAAERFVPAHPIAGSEKTGVQNASKDLLDDKVVILTPTDRLAPALRSRAEKFWTLTGARVITMSPEEHDRRLAAVSHVPHLVSSLLASMLDDESRPLVGSGWRDMTRVAAGDPTMWSAICAHNREAIVGQIERLEIELDRLRQLIAAGDMPAVKQWLENAKQRKDASQIDHP